MDTLPDIFDNNVLRKIAIMHTLSEKNNSWELWKEMAMTLNHNMISCDHIRMYIGRSLGKSSKIYRNFDKIYTLLFRMQMDIDDLQVFAKIKNLNGTGKHLFSPFAGPEAYLPLSYTGPSLGGKKLYKFKEKKIPEANYLEIAGFVNTTIKQHIEIVDTIYKISSKLDNHDAFPIVELEYKIDKRKVLQYLKKIDLSDVNVVTE